MVTLRPRDSLLFFNWDAMILDWDSKFFSRGVPGLTVTFCNKITGIAQLDFIRLIGLIVIYEAAHHIKKKTSGAQSMTYCVAKINCLKK